MKAFCIVLAALVACVQARSLLTKDDLLLKDSLLTNTHRFSVVPKKALLNSAYDYVPTTYDDNVETYNTYNYNRYLSIDELVSHPLFREYLRIPIFRQFWERYPTVMRRYVESPLFQRYWQVPEFQQYFKNPFLFYKYVYSQIQVIAQSTEETYNYDYGYNRGVETRRPFYPYSQYQTQSVYGQVNHKYLLEKLYSTLFFNKPTVGDFTKVQTNVKIEPAHKEVEPITGEIKVVEPRIVDVKVNEKIIPQTQTAEEVEGQWTVKEQLLKKLLVTKQISFPLYEVLKTLPLHHVKEIVRRIVPTIDFADVEDVAYPYNRFNEIDHQRINQIIDQLYNKEIVGDRYTPVVPTTRFDDIIRRV